MDVERASDQIDALIERRAKERSKANEEEAFFKVRDRRDREKRRRENLEGLIDLHGHLHHVYLNLALRAC
jgi:hypothetical protein